MSRTLTQLRQAIGMRTGQPFFTQFSDGGEDGTTTALGTTTTAIDTDLLKQEDNFWRGAFVLLHLAGGETVREIDSFTSSTSTLTWLAPTSVAIPADTDYELWNTFTPGQVKAAINAALRGAWPNFYEMTSERLAILSDVPPVYTLPTATHTIRRINKVILCLYNSDLGETTSTASAQNQIVDSAGSFSSSDIGKLVIIYEGTDDSAGDIRTVSAVPDANTLTVSSNFTATIGSGVKYRLVDLNTEQPTFIPIDGYKLDNDSFPTQIWLESHLTGYEGHFLLLEYEYQYEELSDPTDTTTCPEEYVILAAMAHLYMMKLAVSPATELRNWPEMQQAATTAAQEYAAKNKFRRPTSTVRRWFPDTSYAADYPFRP